MPVPLPLFVFRLAAAVCHQPGEQYLKFFQEKPILPGVAFANNTPPENIQLGLIVLLFFCQQRSAAYFLEAFSAPSLASAGQNYTPLGLGMNRWPHSGHTTLSKSVRRSLSGAIEHPHLRQRMLSDALTLSRLIFCF